MLGKAKRDEVPVSIGRIYSRMEELLVERVRAWLRAHLEEKHGETYS